MKKTKLNSLLAIESLEQLLLMSASVIEGTDGADWITGTGQDDEVFGRGGNDFLHNPLGNNRIDGGDGLDIFIVYQDSRDAFSLTRLEDDRLIIEGEGLNGTRVTNELINVELILFNDGLIRTDSIPITNLAPDVADNQPSSDEVEPESVPPSSNGVADDNQGGVGAESASNEGNESSESSSNGTAGADGPDASNPTAEDDTFVAVRNTNLFGNVSVNDSDSDAPNYALLYSIVDNVDQGTLNFYGDGSFDYYVGADFTRDVQFSYMVTDADGNTDEATVTISAGDLDVDLPEDMAEEQSASADDTSLPATDEFQTKTDVFAVQTNGTSVGNLLTNDTDSLSGALAIAEFSNAQFGAVTISDDGDFQYAAADGFQGIDYFHYVVSDGDRTDRVTAIIHVGPDGAVPPEALELVASNMVVSPIVFDLNEDGVINVTGPTTAKDRSADLPLGETVQFDIDGDGSLNTIEWIDGSGDGILVDVGRIQGQSIDGTALFGDEGGAYENGFEKLRLKDTDGNGILEEGELSDLRLWIDDGDGKLQAGELESLESNDIFAISTRMRLTADGLMQSQAFKGNDREILIEDVWFGEATDSSGESGDTDNESSDPNASPDADPDVFQTTVGRTITGNLLLNDSDPDGDRLLVSRHSRAIHGTLSVDDDGRFTYTPDAGFEGVDYFQYEITDGNGGKDLAVATINVRSGNAAIVPTGNKVTGTVWHDANGNGRRDAAETSRGTSVFVSLLDSSGSVVQTTHTDGDGGYQFDGLADGEYRIQISAASLPGNLGRTAQLTVKNVNSNFFDAVDSDVGQASGRSSIVRLSDDQSTATIDAGYVFV